MLCLLVIAVTGCLGSTGPGSQDGYEMEPGEETVNGTPVCLYPNVDPAIPDCLVTERPPDVRYENRHVQRVNLTLRVVRNGSTVIFEDTVTDVPKGGGGVWEDVFARPGNYTLAATLNGSKTDRTSMSIGRRYRGSGGAEYFVRVLKDGRLVVGKIPHT